MGNTIDALRAIYTALGGNADNVADLVLIPDLLNAIATLLGASGGVLPAVSATDNGSVLKVADGAWGVGTDAT